MASEQLYGNAEFRWTDSQGNNQTHPLKVPLQSITPASFQRSWTSESMNGKNFETIQVGDYLPQRQCEIRLEDDYESLIQLLRAGIDQKRDLTYDDGDNTDVLKIVDPNEISSDIFEREEDYSSFQEVRVQIVVRKTNGTSFNTHLNNPAI